MDAVDEYGVTGEEREIARRYSMAIDWSDEDQLFLASFPGIPFVRTHGATREEAADRGDEVIIAWLTALRDAGSPVPPPLTARTAIVEEPPEFDAERIRR